MNMKMIVIQLDGSTAYGQGLSESTCPFKKDSEEYKNWMIGYNRSKKICVGYLQSLKDSI